MPEKEKQASVIIYSGLVLIFIFEYLNPVKYFPFLGSLYLNTLIPIFTLSLLILTVGFKNNKWNSKQSYLYTALAVLVIFSVFHALIKTSAFEKTKVFVGYFIFYFLIINTVVTINRFRVILWTLTIIHLVVAGLNPDYLNSQERNIGLLAGFFLGNGNDFSLSLILLLPWVLYLFFKEEKKILKISIGIAGVIIILLILIAASRASALALAAMLIYMWIRLKNKLLGSIILGAVFMGVVFFGPQAYFDRIESIKNYEEDTSARGRLDAWQAGLEMAIDNPILGVGAGNFNSVYGRWYKPEDAVHTRWISPHSTYVQCMAELGFTGLILFLSIILCNFKSLSSIRKRINESANKYGDINMLLLALDMSLIGFCVNGAFLGAFYYPHHFVISGFIVSLMHIVENKQMITSGAGLEDSIPNSLNKKGIPLSKKCQGNRPTDEFCEVRIN